MKKLLIATDNFLPRWDGVSRFLYELIPFLKNDFDIRIVCPNFGDYNIEDVKLTKFNLTKFNFGDYTFAKVNKKNLIKEIKDCDIIFSQTLGPIGMSTIKQSKKHNKKLICFAHSLEWELIPRALNSELLSRVLQPIIKLVIRHLYNKTDLIICPSESVKELLEWSGMNSKKEVVNLGVNHNSFTPYKNRTSKEKKEIDSLKKKYGLENNFVIGNHGRLAREKDLNTLLRSFSWLRKKYENVKLVIVGDGVLSIKNKILSMEDVILIERSDEVHKVLNLFDCYVTSSKTETTSLSTLEAMSSGLCVISTPTGFIGEYIIENKNGFLFPQGNAFVLFKYLELILNNVSLKKSIGEHARQTILKKFTWKNTASKVSKILK